MEPEFWHRRWEERQIGFHQEQFNPHLERFWGRLDLPPESRVFVPLCGKSLDLLWLAGAGHSVTGIELSPIAVAEFFHENRLTATRTTAERFAVEEAEQVRLLCGDFFDLQPDDLAGVRAAYDRASLIALPPSMRQRYAAHLQAVLPADAAILLVTLDYPQHEMDGPPFAVSAAEVADLYGDNYRMEALWSASVLDESPRFRERGVTRMEERVLLLTPR